MTPHFKNIKEYILHLQSFGNKVALVNSVSSVSITYTELTKNIFIISESLQTFVGSGDRVILKNLIHEEWIQVFFALLLNEAIAAPVDHRMSEDFFAEIIEYIKPKFIITSGLPIDSKDIPVLIVKDLFTPNHTAIPAANLKSITLDTPAEIIFTSGTWSKPKGVVLSHGNLLSNLEGLLHEYVPSTSDVFLSILPLAHAYEQMCGMFLPLYAGSSIVSMGDITPKNFLETINKYRVTKIIAVPRILELLRKNILHKIKNLAVRKIFIKAVKAVRILPIYIRRKVFMSVHKAMGPDLKTLVVGGAALSQELDYFFQGLGYEIFIGYGLSETAPVLTISLEQKRTQGDIGKALSNVHLKINESGEIVASGPNIFLGYWPNPSQVTEFNTQDLGTIDAQGHVHIMGRTKNLLIYPSGDKLFLEDIEYITDGIPGVEESCAINKGGNGNNPDINILIVSKQVDKITIKAAIQSRLPYFAKIQKIIIVSGIHLPRTHTLKLNRKQITEKLSFFEEMAL